MSNHSSTLDVPARLKALTKLFSPLARISALLLSLVLSSVTLIVLASAATITVGDAGDPTTGDAAKCNVPNTCTLRDAIAKAADVTGTAVGDTIVFNLPANSAIILSGSELLVDRNLTIDGSTSLNLAISGNNVSRVFEVGDGIVATLEQLIIKNGKSGSDGGGGINNRGTLTLSHSTLSDNTATGDPHSDGGGIVNFSALTLIDSTVANNTATYGGGGGINSYDGASLTLSGSTVSGNTAYIGGGISNHSGPLTLTSSTVTNNTANSDDGGGILNTSGTLTLTSSTVADNTALSGGGIANFSGTGTVTGCEISGNTSGGIANYYGILTLTDSMVLGNTTSDSAGGIYNNSIMTLIRSTVAANTASGFGFYVGGGGIYNSGILALIDSTTSGNTAANGSGGGIYNSNVTALLTLTGSMISDNTAGYSGGGIYDNGNMLTVANSTVSGNTANGIHGIGGGIASSNLILINSTVSGNTAGDHGGGIYAGVSTIGAALIHGTLANNTVAGIKSDIYNANYLAPSLAVNTITQSCEVNQSNPTVIIDNGGNLDGGNGCGFTSLSSKSNATLNLSVLADNGGPTLTMMPGANSDAIGRGLPSACRSAPVNSRDQRDYVRPAIGCSSGAVDPNGLANESIFFDGFGLGGQ